MFILRYPRISLFTKYFEVHLTLFEVPPLKTYDWNFLSIVNKKILQLLLLKENNGINFSLYKHSIFYMYSRDEFILMITIRVKKDRYTWKMFLSKYKVLIRTSDEVGRTNTHTHTSVDRLQHCLRENRLSWPTWSSHFFLSQLRSLVVYPIFLLWTLWNKIKFRFRIRKWEDESSVVKKRPVSWRPSNRTVVRTHSVEGVRDTHFKSKIQKLYFLLNSHRPSHYTEVFGRFGNVKKRREINGVSGLRYRKKSLMTSHKGFVSREHLSSREKYKWQNTGDNCIMVLCIFTY